MRIEHDYHRNGALAYLAAWDVHRGQITGRCEDTTGIEPFSRLVEQVMTSEPYASADRMFWIVTTARLTAVRPRSSGCARLGRTRTWSTCPSTPPGWTSVNFTSPPCNAKVVNPNNFTDTDQIRDRLAAFETRYNTVARPFNWKFTRSNLDDLLHRIGAHEQPQDDQRQAA